MTLRNVLVGVCLAVLFTGCATMRGGELPEMTLVNMKVSEVTLFETSLDLTVRISNESPEAIRLDGGVVKLELQGMKVGKGLIQETIEIDRLSSTTVTLPVHISNLALATRIRTILESDELTYGLEGKLYQQTPLGTRRVKALGSGRFDFGRLQAPPPAP